MIDRGKFYEVVRKNFGTLKQKQVDGFEAILTEWESSGLTDLRWLSYILATCWHETAKTMQAIEEYGKGKGRKYGKPDHFTGHVYYGRGFVQLTWNYNYKKMGEVLGVDLLHNPQLALDTDIATKIMFTGMQEGYFTGKKLSDYFNEQKEDWLNARRIINGRDKAELIAEYGRVFLSGVISKNEA